MGLLFINKNKNKNKSVNVRKEASKLKNKIHHQDKISISPLQNTTSVIYKTNTVNTYTFLQPHSVSACNHFHQGIRVKTF